ncbi:MAG: exopolysaccharide biosynthesis polyprenyl glycosylphosphotransferase [Anaerolineales bacterium]|nr:exopolysaccharide biosynthesis polyprenyl glycosylphosphotransferase [Chloroflexota bacterium]MBL6981682.1 exopolysaccharide biosynthesis polyprenyl glycosylphosphotransferase [Anaerolineales bacterium]
MAKHHTASILWRLGMRERRTLLFLGDLFFGAVALVAALIVWGLSEEWLGLSLAFIRERVENWFYVLPIVWILLIVGLYDVHRASHRRQVINGILGATSIGFILYLFVYFASDNPLPRRGVAAFLALASLLTLAWRLLYIRIFTAPALMRRVLVVGAGRAGNTIIEIIDSLDPKPFELVGLIDDSLDLLGTDIEGYRVIANSENLLEIVESEAITDIIVAISGTMMGSTFQNILDAQERGVEITRMPVAYEELVNRVPINLLETDWILRSFVDEFRIGGFYEVFKRLVDIIGGMVGILFVGLILPFVGLAIIIDNGWPIFYGQERLGKGGQVYEIIKFRTMRRDAEADGQAQLAQEDDERVTRIGRILRRTHLDEFPQFYNVLRGDMSLVGPRAERPQLVDHFQRRIPFYRARLLVKPGITGWAQVNYGYASNLAETMMKLEYDLYYIKHRNLLLDVLILLRTPATMLGKGQ